MLLSSVNPKKTPNKQQHCPICNRYVRYHATYPNYVCAKCTALATDKEGKLIAFYHITQAGTGLQGKYLDTGKFYRSPFCYIKTIKCKAEENEAGIIIRPSTIRKRKPKRIDQSDLPIHSVFPA
ncbi:hypothetical protein [Mucilaginibacter lacusdianchii]|uniref:hypothetical protein n=1 Tax=Mucilaginibacter lacusdianchii TaxID=2684211 RepID=UPI00131B149F|nr:hypothetical protein [Mucilaginibacter sp. JXJ CY 39]